MKNTDKHIYDLVEEINRARDKFPETDFELLEVKRFRRALALKICESKLCFECHTDAEHCEEVKQEMEARLKDAGA